RTVSVLAVCGPQASGKTTFLRMLAASMPPGTVYRHTGRADGVITASEHEPLTKYQLFIMDGMTRLPKTTIELATTGEPIDVDGHEAYRHANFVVTLDDADKINHAEGRVTIVTTPAEAIATLLDVQGVPSW